MASISEYYKKNEKYGKLLKPVENKLTMLRDQIITKTGKCLDLDFL